MRTKYCGEIRLSDINKQVIVCGWVDRIRKLKKMIFINLRDQEGIIQILFDPINTINFNIAMNLKNEFCIQIIGIVQKRLSNNLNLITGNIEILAKKINILSISEELPININNINSEKNRLKYRYLDLRHPNMIKNIKIRSHITDIIRLIMMKKKFLNIETPILTKSTPEGARDYLVPSRIHKGKYYALPQSPQIFKQLLMISGIDKYYQIVKCFRDEDLRSDRQPEFTQIDIEASFTTSKKIRNISEMIIKKLWNKILGIKLNKFPVISYYDAIKKYGSEKPDLRNPIELIDIHDIASNIFESFTKNNNKIRTAALLIPNGLYVLKKNMINSYYSIIKKYQDIHPIYIKIKSIELGEKGIFSSSSTVLGIQNLIDIIKRVKAKNGDTILILSGKINITNQVLNILRIKIGKEIKIIANNIWKPIWIIDFPMFIKNDANVLLSTHHPFTAPKGYNIHQIKSNPQSIISDSYDLVINGYEIGGGSVRINNKEMQETVFQILGITPHDQNKKFGFFINALKYGTPPHAGIALGLDRISMLLTRSNNIKDVIAFPKSNSATCLMTGAPSEYIY